MLLLDSGLISSFETMKKDADLLENLEETPILHLYEMEGNAATYGHFTKPETLLNLSACEEESIVLAKRPTGGGIIFHFLDLAFSYFVPKSHPLFSENTLQNYHSINARVLKVIEPLLPNNNFTFLDQNPQKISSFCMAHPTPFDLLCNGKKIAGAAQRKTRKGFLHQGSLSILAPKESLLKKILKDDLASDILKNSFYLTDDPFKLKEFREILKNELIKNFKD